MRIDKRELSYWEFSAYLKSEITIVGGGLTGLAVAASILEKMPNTQVTILERGTFPTGASTRNAGFACFGSLTEILSDIESFGEDHTKKLLENRFSGLQILEKRLQKLGIPIDYTGGYELLPLSQTQCLDYLDQINCLVQDVIGIKPFSLNYQKISSFGLEHSQVEALIENSYEGVIHPGMAVLKLAQYVQSLGAKIFYGTDVLEYDSSETGCILKVRTSPGEYVDFKSRSIFVCTNGYSSNAFSHIDVKPARGQVILSKPILDIPLRGAFHFDRGFGYFRNIENRLLFGGLRNLDFEGETRQDFGTSKVIQDSLRNKVKELFCFSNQIDIEMSWSGIMGFTSNKMPIIKPLAPHTYLIAGMSGMGVALSQWCGEEALKTFTCLKD